EDEFDSAVKQLRDDFPRVEGWLNWWLRPAFASMIFPSRSQVSPALIERLPGTSNPVETQHSLLHRATGTDQDAHQGVKKIFLHVEEIRAQYNAILSGHFLPPSKPQQSRRPPTKKFNENDGRAPDTAAALQKTNVALEHAIGIPKSKQLVESLASTTSSNLPSLIGQQTIAKRHQYTSLYLQSYTWSAPNSCFFDTGLELWFRAFAAWSTTEQDEFLESVPSKSAIAGIFYHYRRRIRILHKENAGSMHTLALELGLCQEVMRNVIFSKWQLYSDAGEYGCAVTWLQRAVMEIDSEEIQLSFAVQHFVEVQCESNHHTTIPASKPEALFRLSDHDARIVHAACAPKSTVDLTDFFLHLIPRRSIGNDANGTTLLHTLTDLHCTHTECSLSMLSTPKIIGIKTSWPKILHIMPETRGSLREEEDVRYELIGRILHRVNHFVAEVLIDGHIFVYNDMNSGKLEDRGNGLLFEEGDRNAVLYVYHRTSSVQLSRREISAILTDFSLHPIFDPTHYTLDDDLDNDDQPPEDNGLGSKVPANRSSTNVESGAESTNLDLNHHHFEASSPEVRRGRSESPCKVGHGGDSELDTIQCCKCQQWSHVKCMEDRYRLPQDYKDEGVRWFCPMCSGEDVWQDNYTGQHLLLQTKQGSSYYPAEVIHSEGSTVTVRWHFGNIYAKRSQKPATDTSTFPVETCLRAKLDAFIRIRSKALGRIEWPARLCDEAASIHDYTNAKISGALEDAFSTIMEIVVGKKDHPLKQEYNTYFKAKFSEHKEAKPHILPRPLDREQWVGSFRADHKLPILLGDASLIDQYLSDLNILLARDQSAQQQHSELQQFSTDTPHLVEIVLGPAYILFGMVIVRTYLSRQPSDDAQIFKLFAERRLVRVLTPHEQACAALNGAEDTQDPLFPASSTRQAALVVVKHNLPDSLQLLSVKTPDNQPYIWTSSTEADSLMELTGGPPYERPHIRPPSPRPRPMPRPIQNRQKTEPTSMKPPTPPPNVPEVPAHIGIAKSSPQVTHEEGIEGEVGIHRKSRKRQRKQSIPQGHAPRRSKRFITNA
ncbi:hypothetical protein BJ138DRAFT_1205112, partial [Hygrophoropsis aurantiaca]